MSLVRASCQVWVGDDLLEQGQLISSEIIEESDASPCPSETTPNYQELVLKETALSKRVRDSLV